VYLYCLRFGYFFIGDYRVGGVSRRALVKVSTLIKDGAIVASMSVLLLSAAELVLRAMYPEKTRPEPLVTESSAYRLDDEYIVDLKPNMTKTYVRQSSNGGDSISWSTNAQGFRGAELRADGSTRVVVYGDSNIQARFSRLEHTFTYRLEHYLDSAVVGGVEVVNAGVVGSGPDQSLLRIMDDYDVIRPDIVILHVFADNDFGDIIRNRLFELDEAGALRSSQHRFSAPLFLNSLLVVRAARKLAGSTTSPLDFVDMATQRSAWEFRLYSSRSRRVVSNFADYYDVDVALRPGSASALAKVELMSGIFGAAKVFADSVGTQLMVLIQPARRDLVANITPSYRELSAFSKYRADGLTSHVHVGCIDHGLPCLNLFEPFSANDPEHLFFKGTNRHWSDEGQDLAARETAAFMLGRLVSIPTEARLN